MAIVFWPKDVLTPSRLKVNPVPFSRSGGRTLGGLERNTRTDRGYWSIILEDIPVHTQAQRRCWNALRAAISGRTGLVVVPAWSFDTAPYPNGRAYPATSTHDDGTLFDDGTSYLNSVISVKMYAAAAIGDTSVQLEIVNAEADLIGVRFSYQYALYETGPASDIAGNIWTVPLTTTIRAPIPAGADLEFDNPTCLCHLADDRALDVSIDYNENGSPTVAFVSADDYWSDLAAGLV